MISRALKHTLLESLTKFPVVGLVGARQAGKTSLAKMIAEERPGEAVYLDLERPSDLAKLTEPELYLEMHSGSLVILDEIQRRPDLFPLLRALVDADRRNGRFLILGSASPDLTRQSSETLAGRIIYHELSPFRLDEIGAAAESVRTLWRRGGYPNSLLAETENDSLLWREAFIHTHLERDIPALGIRIAFAALLRFWQMVAHSHGQLWNASKIAGSLGVSATTVRHYLDLLQDTFMLRQLQPLHANLKKRLVKSPKVYLRDSGLLHALLGIREHDDLLAHPVAGPSWEGWVIEQILGAAPRSWGASFLRTSAGAEIDLVLQRPRPKPLVAVEIKYSAAPALSQGFWSALSELEPVCGFVVYPGEESYPLGKGVMTLPVGQLGLLWES